MSEIIIGKSPSTASVEYRTKRRARDFLVKYLKCKFDRAESQSSEKNTEHCIFDINSMFTRYILVDIESASNCRFGVPWIINYDNRNSKLSFLTCDLLNWRDSENLSILDILREYVEKIGATLHPTSLVESGRIHVIWPKSTQNEAKIDIDFKI